MLCSTIAELVEALNNKIEKGMEASDVEMGNLASSVAPNYVYVNQNDATGQTPSSIEGKYKGDKKVEIKHDYGMITPTPPKYHVSVFTGEPFAGEEFISAMHDGGRSGILNPQIAVPTKHMDKIAEDHRGGFVAIAKKNIE